jgi:DNA-3-methyladenine glycosylase
MDSLLRLNRSFFNRPTLIVAQELLSKILVFNNYKGYITETEAYIGNNDPACHAAIGRTKRTEVMFGPAGYSYVYFIYGMYYCLNFVTENEGFPAAVLIRGIKLLDHPYTHLNGPGKLCKYLGITKSDNSVDITQSEKFYVTPRIGIKVGTDLPWRFVII